MQIVDQFERKINYLRVSVTDRCDLRCLYCMKEKMTFLPREDILSLEELDIILHFNHHLSFSHNGDK